MKTQTQIPVFYTGTSGVDNEVEIWRPVRDYEKFYEVSNWGRIKSLNYRQTGKEGILKPMHRNCDKYLRIALCKNNKREYRYLHRIVAEAFIPNPFSLPETNHIDTDPRNCRADNLQWCTHEQNTNHWLTRLHRSKKIYCYNSKGDLEYTYNSLASCAKCIGLSSGHLGLLIRKKNGIYKDFKFSYTRL